VLHSAVSSSSTASEEGSKKTAIVVLTLSSLCPSLKHLIPDIGALQTLVIESIKPWASPDWNLDAVPGPDSWI
jgi:hypothetical protein